MFNKLKITDDEKNKAFSFVQWCSDNKKDLLKMAFDKDYMKICVDEYEGEMKND